LRVASRGGDAKELGVEREEHRAAVGGRLKLPDSLDAEQVRRCEWTLRHCRQGKGEKHEGTVRHRARISEVWSKEDVRGPNST
jgi:hypothetical protein